MRDIPRKGSDVFESGDTGNRARFWSPADRLRGPLSVQPPAEAGRGSGLSI